MSSAQTDQQKSGSQLTAATENVVASPMTLSQVATPQSLASDQQQQLQTKYHSQLYVQVSRRTCRLTCMID